MTILVTGASGHVGVNLVDRLVSDGHDVRILVHHNPCKAVGKVEVFRGDVLDPKSMHSAMDGVETVYHLAAKISITGSQRGLVEKVNVTGAGNVAKAACAQDARMVHVSSVHAFDLALANGQTIDEGHPKSKRRQNYAYDRSKAAGEEMVRAEVANGLDAVIVNPTGIIGPADPGPSRMGNVFCDLKSKRMPALVSGAFDFVDVRDVVDSLVAAMSKGDASNHLLGGNHMSVAEIADEVSKVVGVSPPKVRLPIQMAALGVPFAALAGALSGKEPVFTRESLGALKHGPPIDSSKAAKVLGHKARPLHETVADFFAWLERQ